MPSSRPITIPTVVHLLRQLQPRSILDVGVGFGKWGHLFREYMDIIEAEHDPARYQRAGWQVRIDGIEGHAAYLTPMHHFLYNEIHVGDAAVLLPTLPRYDLIFFGDIIEHFEKAAGLQLLRQALERANKAVLVSTPKFETAQDELCGNELERHRSLWTAKDFRRFKGARVKTIGGSILLALLPSRDMAHLKFTPPRHEDPADLVHLQAAREQIRKLIPRAEAFILVDEEQLRTTLPHARPVPFLERRGLYWGPPSDDATAIAEFERLRVAGAKFIVFIWSTFWWLKHWGAFAKHLRSRFAVLAENEHLLIFDLQKAALA